MMWVRINHSPNVIVSRVLPEPYRNKGCNRQGDRSLARTVPVFLCHTQHKLLYAFLVERALGCLNLQLIGDEPHGKKGSDRADSSDLFAGRTLVLRQ
jgi:hypothetical protein